MFSFFIVYTGGVQALMHLKSVHLPKEASFIIITMAL
jgi:hypothetical protein